MEWISAVDLIRERYPSARRGDRTTVHKDVCLGSMESERMETDRRSGEDKIEWRGIRKKKPYRGANGEWTVNMWAKQGREVMCNPLSTDHHRVRVQRDWTLGARRWSEQAHLLQEAPGAPWGRIHPTGWDSGVIRLDENCIRLGRPAIDHGPSISTKGFRCAVPVVQLS